MRFLFLPFFGLILTSLIACKHDPEPPTVEPVDSTVCFARDILPIYQHNCALGGCHDTTGVSGGFVFTNYEEIRNSPTDVDDPALVVAGQADSSFLYQVLTDTGLIMPPSGQLPALQLDLIKRWINQGGANSTCQ